MNTMSNNEQRKAVVEILENNGIQAEALLLGTHAKALALISTPAFAAAVMPDELNIVRSKEDVDVATSRFAKEIGLTVAVIHAASVYVQAKLDGREYDKSIVLNNYNLFNTLDAEKQRDMVIDVLRFMDSTVTNLCKTVASEADIKELDSNPNAFDEYVEDLSNLHIHTMLEGFSQILSILGGVINVHIKGEPQGASFLDSTKVNQKIGSLLGLQLEAISKTILGDMIGCYLQNNLSQENYEIVEAMLEKAVNSSSVH